MGFVVSSCLSPSCCESSFFPVPQNPNRSKGNQLSFPFEHFKHRIGNKSSLTIILVSLIVLIKKKKIKKSAEIKWGKIFLFNSVFCVLLQFSGMNFISVSSSFSELFFLYPLRLFFSTFIFQSLLINTIKNTKID